jgi:2-methylisocitrate lyase-like PEP mutase family enzyme
MDQKRKAAQFAKLHVKGTPLVLYNAWDAGSAKAVVAAGAKAIATGSWSVAEAQGYRDGEAIPKDFVMQIASRIADAVNVPVSIDFEGGYSDSDSTLTKNVSRLIELGIIGINFEDRVVKGKGLYTIERQARRIAAIREAAEKKDIPLFINARTDLFLGEGDDDPAKPIDEAVERAKAYAAAGASGFFIPGLTKSSLIERICKAVSLPLNVMVMDGVPSNERLSQLGVARISYGPIPYLKAMDSLEKAARKILS